MNIPEWLMELEARIDALEDRLGLVEAALVEMAADDLDLVEGALVETVDDEEPPFEEDDEVPDSEEYNQGFADGVAVARILEK